MKRCAHRKTHLSSGITTAPLQELHGEDCYTDCIFTHLPVTSVHLRYFQPRVTSQVTASSLLFTHIQAPITNPSDCCCRQKGFRIKGKKACRKRKYFLSVLLIQLGKTASHEDRLSPPLLSPEQGHSNFKRRHLSHHPIRAETVHLIVFTSPKSPR